MSVIAVPSFQVDASEEGEGFRVHVRDDSGEDRSYSVPTGTQQDFSKFFASSPATSARACPHIFARRRGTARADDPLAAAADRERPSADPRRLRRPGRLQGWQGLLACRHLERRARRLPDPPFARPRALGAEGFVFPEGQRPRWCAQGRNVADFWAPEMAQGRRANIGSSSPPARRSNALAIGLARSAGPTGPWIDNGEPLITGKPLNTTGLGYDARPAAAERRSDRSPPLRRRGRRRPTCSGRTTRTASGRGRWRCCCASHPELIERLFESEEDRRTRRLRRRHRPLGQRAAADGALLPHAAVDRGGARQLGAGEIGAGRVRACRRDPRGDDDADPRPAHRRRRPLADRRGQDRALPTTSTGKAI